MVKFYNGRKLVYTVVGSVVDAINLVNEKGLEWTRYKTVKSDTPVEHTASGFVI